MNLRGKRVLMRVDANVPIKKGKVLDGVHGKIARAAVDIEWLAQRGAKVIVLTHLGRPKGKRVSAYSTKPIAKRLESLLGFEVMHSRDIVGKKALAAVEKLENGDVLLLENVRYDAREEKNSPAFAQALAKLADIYVNDAFAVSHRAHASVDAITDELPSYAGPLVANEVQILTKVSKRPKTPVVLAMGGLKVRSKLPVMKHFLPNVDSVFVGGALANAFLKAAGYEIGKSVYDKEGVKIAKQLLKKWKKKLLLPIDVHVATSFRSKAKVRNIAIEDVKKTDVIVDVGRRTMRAYLRELEDAKTIIWNGPFGYCEASTFCHGTRLLARAIAARTGKATTVVGGGDTAPFVESAGVADRFTLLSTGGGAMLEFLAGNELPGLEAVKK